MKRKIVIGIYAVGMAAVIVIAVLIGVGKLPSNYQSVSKLILSLITCVFSLVHLLKAKSRNVRTINGMEWLDEYAFPDDAPMKRKYNQAIVLYGQKRYLKAEKLLKAMDGRCYQGRDHAAVWVLMGECLDESGNRPAAIEAYEKALSYDGQMGLAWSNLGLYYLKENNIQKAFVSYEKAVALAPDSPLPHSNQATAYMRIGEYDKAIRAAQKALQIMPNMVQPMSALALAYLHLGYHGKAKQYYDLYVNNGGNGDKLKNMMENIKE